jgi:hypothetical protein
MNEEYIEEVFCDNCKNLRPKNVCEHMIHSKEKDGYDVKAFGIASIMNKDHHCKEFIPSTWYKIQCKFYEFLLQVGII